MGSPPPDAVARSPFTKTATPATGVVLARDAQHALAEAFTAKAWPVEAEHAVEGGMYMLFPGPSHVMITRSADLP
ncbi:hypothetical protein J4573_16275 [Actinomadura barringtoniae]|uniref:Uncharacterized protein n=1 Tax=Actinomadura barringtoniae TaxID=1427535 RepID=A0A939T4T4_9ACTN|nr:hypothetical protein [Actinomadura barringtoniae]MBO2448659.1 hypothetical protein [Actinomadura barringtoniae]